RICLCFFFQAEDGIRDFHVTGVQTCALPIFLDRARTHPHCERRLQVAAGAVVLLLGEEIVTLGTGHHRRLTRRTPGLARAGSTRSEERRVGKEGRYEGRGDE